MQNITKTFIWITAFSITMGFLETAVVVYLRELYYPDNNLFPLAQMNETVIITELLREAATIIMLFSVGYLAGRRFITAFAWFIYSFAIWDIFYYVFLKLILNWPESFYTWDILFLLPTLWTGPVIAPLITCIMMIFLGLSIVWFDLKIPDLKLNKPEWFLLILGSCLLIIGFSWDYSVYMLGKFNFTQLFSASNRTEVMNWSLSYIPKSFNWLIFIISELIIASGILLFFARNKKNVQNVK